MSEFDTFWTTLVALCAFGLAVGVIFALIAGSVKMGIRYAPWILALGFIIYLIG